MRAAAILAAVAALLLAPAARAEERIRDFASDVRIARDGGLTVAETITVLSEGNEIRRGIQRDFPTSYRTPAGQRSHVGFDIVSVTRDGAAEPYSLFRLTNGERVRIGRAEVLLDPGLHRYVITYRTTRQLRYDRDYDELYWNVTGTGWTFPIDAASVRITLPVPARFGQRAVYTGPQGATGQAAVVSAEAPGSIAFRTTAPLGREEGLTVAVAFPKGVVDAPGGGTRARWWLADWGALVAGIAALVALVAYQVRAWWVAGRGPRAGTIVPRFVPPDGLGAAATRFVARMGMDNRVFTAAIVESAVMGQLHIDKRDGGWFARDTTTLRRTPGGRPVGAAEQAMLDALFADGADEIALKQENHAALQAARRALGNRLKADHEGRDFVGNADWAVLGLLAVPVAAYAVAVVAALTGASPGTMLSMPLVGLAAAAAAFVFWRLARGRSGCLSVVAWMLTVGAAIACVMATFATVAANLIEGVWPVLLPLAALPIALLAFKWMAAPTPAGRATMDRIAGFKHYLGITEESRLEALHPPEKTPALFERYLPYAIALDVENSWADRFSGVLAAAAAAAAGGAAQQMAWYSGQGDVWSDPGGFAASVGSSLNASVASASTSPSSGGGGSGGGGSSGGGGGGGGGSGW